MIFLNPMLFDNNGSLSTYLHAKNKQNTIVEIRRFQTSISDVDRRISTSVVDFICNGVEIGRFPTSILDGRTPGTKETGGPLD